MINTILSTEQQVALSLTPETQLNNPAVIVGIPLWNSSNVSVCSLTVAANGMSATAIAGTTGVSIISAIGNGGTLSTPIQISGSTQITVEQAGASQLVFSVGSPVLQ